MWNVHSNLFGSSFRVISGALVQSNLLTYFRRNARQKVKLFVRSRRGGRGRCPPGFANNCPILTVIRELYSIAFDDDGYKTGRHHQTDSGRLRFTVEIALYCRLTVTISTIQT